MSYMYDPSGRRRRPSQPAAARPPGAITLEDYVALEQAYDELKAYAQKMALELSTRTKELAIKDEALHKQGNDLKQTQSELLWTRAALEQTQGDSGANQAAAPQAAEPVDWQDKYVRLQAEIENLRRRWEKRSDDEIAEARRAILRDMLPLADHLEMALEHADALQGKNVKAFVGSIETTLRAFLETLRRYGVERQEALGAPFDPEKHEAVGQMEAEGVEPGHIAQVVRSGYSEGDRLLRPARVMVAR